MPQVPPRVVQQANLLLHVGTASTSKSSLSLIGDSLLAWQRSPAILTGVSLQAAVKRPFHGMRLPIGGVASRPE
jgi:hypothetical protein